MDKRIIYQLPEQPLAVLIPCECGLTVEQIGKKDVPAGIPFWIVDADTIPSDRSFRAAWELDVESMGTPSGYGNPDKINQKILDIIEKEKNALLSSEFTR